MTAPHPDPHGVQHFEFIEFAAPEAEALHDLFTRLGFTAVARHRQQPLTLYRQGDINFVINESADGFAADFARQHGPSCCGFALRVNDAALARQQLVEAGVAGMDQSNGLSLALPAVAGIGGSALYLTQSLADLEAEFEFIDGVERHPKGVGLGFVDHLTHNVRNGNMDQWADFYHRHFGFREIKYFDIKGSQTGLRSRAMTAPNGAISIPINESENPKSQINEYIDQYQGEGVQHIALYTDHIHEAVEQLHANDVAFLDTPDTYFDAIDERIPDHGEDVERMRANKILIDADVNNPDLKLLQIFTHTNIGPIFFEIIQRKGNEGFGEGNFQALFEAIERDQKARGVL